MAECGICLLPYTAVARKEAKCLYCKISACVHCIKASILMSVDEPSCPHCRRAYTAETIDAYFTKTWRKNELRKHRIHLLMERERSLFPATQDLLEIEKAQDEYANMYALHSSLLVKLSPRDTEPVPWKLVEHINSVREKLKLLSANVIEVTKEKRKFVRKCPSCPDGFLSNQWKCTLCSVRVCHECLDVKTDVHACNPDNVASAKIIEADTRPCPTCGVRVQKINGCNQMWCTACKNAFDWKTGRKIDGVVHNPHFHEYAMANRDWTRQNECQETGIWEWNYVPNLLRALNHKLLVPLDHGQQVNIMMVNRYIIERVVMIQNFVPYTPDTYVSLRKRRLKGEINDAEWARQLSWHETSRERQRRFRRLDEFLVGVCRDIFDNFIRRESTAASDVQTMFTELSNTRTYYNSQLLVIGEKLQVSERWVIETI